MYDFGYGSTILLNKLFVSHTHCGFICHICLIPLIVVLVTYWLLAHSFDFSVFTEFEA